MATVNTKYEGWIEKLRVNATGIYVKTGEPLADIYSPELLATQREFLNALKWKNSTKKESELGALLVKDAETILEGARERLRLWDITDEQIKKIEETGQPIKTLTLYSPVSGYVTQKMAIQGMKVMPGDKLFDIVDLSSVWVLADIYEYELPVIKVGEQAAISLDLSPGQRVFLENRLYLSNPGRGNPDGQGQIHPSQSRGAAQTADVHRCDLKDQSRQKARCS